MQSFEWVDATSVEQAAGLISGDSAKPSIAKAGGMDVLDLMKEGIVSPARLVNLKTIPGLDGIRQRSSGEMELGCLTTLAAIEASPEIRARYIALAEAASHAATPQVRNAATIGGNLLQKPRCWYYRNAYFRHANESGARLTLFGENQYHAIFDNSKTPIVHASTPATALVAYYARIELTGRGGQKRTVSAREFFLPVEFGSDRTTIIEPGEILTHVVLPALPQGARAAYLKQTERESYDWPICDVAVVMNADGPNIRSVSIVMGWVAPIPKRATEAERLLSGKSFTEELARDAARAAVAGASPLSKNSYKIPVLEAVVRRTLLAAGKTAA
jgi:xanthine dehydrogenase YagS FAD-binding subunit